MSEARGGKIAETGRGWLGCELNVEGGGSAEEGLRVRVQRLKRGAARGVEGD